MEPKPIAGRSLWSSVIYRLGAGLFLASAAEAGIGPDHGPRGVIGTIIAFAGLALIFTDYYLNRAAPPEAQADVSLKFFLGLGCLYPVIGLLYVTIAKNPSIPIGYFIAVGCVSIPAFLVLHTYTKRRRHRHSRMVV
jgi:hypothetical protein